MFTFVFWILLIWFIVNIIWMWFVLNKQTCQKTFAWVNVCVVIIGFWVLYGLHHNPGAVADWFTCLNWANVVLACIQFYFGYRKISTAN